MLTQRYPANRYRIERELGTDGMVTVYLAEDHYRAYVEIWKGADPELQPRVTQAGQRLAVLELARIDR